MISVVVVTMAGLEVGMGHYQRMRVLLRELEALGCTVALRIIDTADELAQTSMEGKVVNSYEALDAELAAEAPNMVIVDMPVRLYNKKFLCQLKQASGIQLVLIDDDEEERGELPFDIKIACSMRFHSRLSSERFWYGPDYMIISPLFKPLIDQPRQVSSEVRRILLSFGGSDPNGITVQVLEYLTEGMPKGTDAAVEVILGRFAAELPSRLVEQDGFTVTVHRNVTDMPDRLWAADLAIISGGMTLYEACSLGTPAMIISQNEEQRQEAAIFSELGSVCDLGHHSGLTRERLRDAIAGFSDRPLRQRMSDKARSHIDGSGSGRIARKLLDAIHSVC